MDPDWVGARTDDREPPTRTRPLRMVIGEYEHQSGRYPVYQATETSTPLTST